MAGAEEVLRLGVVGDGDLDRRGAVRAETPVRDAERVGVDGDGERGAERAVLRSVWGWSSQPVAVGRRQREADEPRRVLDMKLIASGVTFSAA